MADYVAGNFITAGFGHPDGSRITPMEVIAVRGDDLECRVDGYSATISVPRRDVVDKWDGTAWVPSS
ncbi:hypothetical protein [Gordonia sihwensis]|uniref:hypothetical protein n=1 Tax=Gordonia sihwensis TaxID=173559 RepID=UPI003D987BFA